MGRHKKGEPVVKEAPTGKALVDKAFVNGPAGDGLLVTLDGQKGLEFLNLFFYKRVPMYLKDNWDFCTQVTVRELDEVIQALQEAKQSLGSASHVMVVIGVGGKVE